MEVLVAQSMQGLTQRMPQWCRYLPNNQEFYEEFGKGSTFPRVKYGEELLGGCQETVKYLKEQNLV